MDLLFLLSHVHQSCLQDMQKIIFQHAMKMLQIAWTRSDLNIYRINWITLQLLHLLQKLNLSNSNLNLSKLYKHMQHPIYINWTIFLLIIFLSHTITIRIQIF